MRLRRLRERQQTMKERFERGLLRILHERAIRRFLGDGARTATKSFRMAGLMFVVTELQAGVDIRRSKGNEVGA